MLRRLPLALLVVVLLTGRAGAQADGSRREDHPAEPAKQPTLTKPPELIEGAAPEYPPDALAEHLEADVPLRIHVGADGTVTAVDVITPQGHGFDEAAVAAALKYRFSPAEFDGKPGPIVVETSIHFQLEEVETPIETPAETAAGAPAVPTVPLIGVVKERGTRSKLSGATIGLIPVDGSAAPADGMADPDGNFHLDAPPGKYTLVAVLQGYDRFKEPIELRADEETHVTIYLRPAGGSPYETTVETAPDPTEVTRHPLSRHELTTVPGTFGDPVRVILSLPGLARSPFSTGFLLIRGSDPDQSGIYIDGHQVPILFHFFGGPSVINPEFLDGLNLYPGGFPVRFGGVIGGIVAVDTRATASDGVHGAAKVDLLDSSVYLRAPINKDVTIAAAARRSYIDVFLPLVEPDSTSVTPVYWDYQLRVDAKLPEQGKLSVVGYGSDDQLDVTRVNADAMTTQSIQQHTGFYRLLATYTAPLTGRLKFSLSPSVGRDSISFGVGTFGLKFVRTVVDLRERVTGKLSDTLRLDSGIDLQHFLTTIDINVPFPSQTVNPFGGRQDGATTLEQHSGSRLELGGFVELGWDVGAHVKLVPGVRLDAWRLHGHDHLSMDPRIVARWQAVPSTTLKAYVGQFHQSGDDFNLDTTFGNPQLGLEQAIHYGAGVERRLAPKLTVEGELYYVDRTDLPARTEDVVENPDGTVQRVNVNNDGVGYTYGFELLLRREISRNFYGWLSYTYSHTEERPHPDEAYVLGGLDQTHNLIGVASYRTDGGWELGGRLQYTTGLLQTDVIGGTFNADSGEYAGLPGPTNGTRLPAFVQLDVRAEKTWTYETWSLGLYFDVINATNRANAEVTTYDYRFREHGVVSGLPIVPTLGVEGHW